MQTKTMSAVEALSNICVGFGVAYLSAVVIYPLVGMQATYGTYLEVTIYFTIVSFCRSYLLRRYFNGPVHMFLQRFKNDNNK